MRLVVDTNVVVSGLLWNGPPRRLLDIARSGDVEIYTSGVLLAELAATLLKPRLAEKLSFTGIHRDDFVLGYADLAYLVAPTIVERVVPDDPDDDHVIACALAASADLIVSGDLDLLKLGEHKGIRIVTVAQALNAVPAGGR